MTDIEKIISIFTNEIKVSLPCKIVKLNKMYADVKPVCFDKVDFPVIPDVPICFLGSSSASLKFKSSIGDIVTVFFTQIDLSNYLARGMSGQVLSTEKFNLTSAFVLPFNLHTKKDNESMPTVDFEIIGDVKITGNLEVDGIDFKTHVHPYTWTGSPGTGNTSPPT